MSQSSNIFLEKEGRKRTLYRRPSALGVPDALFPKDSEYLSNYKNNEGPKREDGGHTRPKTTMKAEGLDFEEGSTNRSQYGREVNLAPRPFKAKPREDVVGPSEGQMDTLSSNKSDFDVKGQVKKPMKVKGHDNLGPLEGSMKEQSEGRSQFKGEFTPKEMIRRPLSNIKSEGDLEFQSKQKDIWVQNHQKVTKTRPKTTMDKSGQLDLNTGMRENYVGLSGEKSKLSKPKNTLQPEGLDFAQGTSNSDYLPNNNFKPLKGQKPSDYLETGGDFEGSSTNRNSYSNPGRKEKVTKTRPKTTMDKSGQFDLITGNRENYSGQPGIRKISPPLKTSLQFEGLDFAQGTQNSEYSYVKDFKPVRGKKLQDHFIRNTEKIDGESEAKKSFRAHDKQGKPLKFRPKTSLDNAGDLDLVTLGRQNSDYLKNIEFRKVKFEKLPDQMSTNGGRFEDETVSKNSFRGFEGQRPTKAGAPAGNLRRIQSAQFDGVKSSQDYFSAVSTVKPTKVRVGTSLRPEGRAEGKSEYHEKFQKSTSMVDLRAKPSWFTELTTPYGTFAEGQARAPGQQVAAF